MNLRKPSGKMGLLNTSIKLTPSQDLGKNKEKLKEENYLTIRVLFSPACT